jgi:thiamine-monophosphate kinase
MRSEAQIIDLIRKRLGGSGRRARRGPNSEWLQVGLGDDAAILNLVPQQAELVESELALSCDSFLEGVHFVPKLHSPEVIGYKSLARATSDLAAVGALPRFYLMNLALPRDRTGRWLERFSDGLARAAREFKMRLIGGDTSRFATIAIGMTVGGDVAAGHALTRSGAHPGDQIFVSGTLGTAQLAFDWLASPRPHRASPPPKVLLERHLRPSIRLALGQWLAGDTRRRLKLASAAIDTSDGLSTDLSHICEASGVAARIYTELLPAVTIPWRSHLGRVAAQFDPLDLALHGGEDYELLFTVPARMARQMPAKYRGERLTRIGEIVRSRRRSRSLIELIDSSGRVRPVEPLGWDSFRCTRQIYR